MCFEFIDLYISKDKTNLYWKIKHSTKIKYKVKIDNCTDSIEAIIDFISKQRRM